LNFIQKVGKIFKESGNTGHVRFSSVLICVTAGHFGLTGCDLNQFCIIEHCLLSYVYA